MLGGGSPRQRGLRRVLPRARRPCPCPAPPITCSPRSQALGSTRGAPSPAPSPVCPQSQGSGSSRRAWRGALPEHVFVALSSSSWKDSDVPEVKVPATPPVADASASAVSCITGARSVLERRAFQGSRTGGGYPLTDHAGMGAEKPLGLPSASWGARLSLKAQGSRRGKSQGRTRPVSQL